ncbi:sialidase family protein [Opitutus sp. ER46]|uniref:sialidase family protein n=1 Tax=Opitutus sp. ER46 TaxID=2161864 RepID=UPI000D2F5F96|nr:sialidase family protein [Opitutus sp. ER46]PTX95707.1 exo-alpha-sialidase [Opitutus sp. ER46]
MSFRLLLALDAALMLGGAGVETQAQPIRPLANTYVVVGESPAPSSVPLYSPSILRLPSGRLLAAYAQASKDSKRFGPAQEILLSSDDHGVTWTRRATSPELQGRLFLAGKAVYYLATGAGLPIQRSADEGVTWSAPRELTAHREVWQQTPANVWYANDSVYLAFEHRHAVIDAWGPSEKGLVLLRARAGTDLTQPAAWTFSSEQVFADVVPGVRDNAINTSGLDFFGVPFLRQNYPHRAVVAESPRRTMPPIGWVEPEVVQILDPDHDWYDPAGHTFHILARAHTGGTGFACLTKVVEQPDGSMTMSLERAPSGKPMLYLPVPGGQLRFHLVYDRQTKLYWMVGSQATDSMRRADRLPPDRFDLPYNERHRLVLHFSRNLVDWCFAGLVAVGNGPGEARHYASMDIDGDDLVILSRSGDARAKSAHEGNLITFHRVRNFRDLVY